SQSLLSNLMLPLDEASPDKRDEYLLQSRLLPPRGDQPHPRGRDPGQCPPHALLALNHNLYPRDASFFVDGCCEPFHAFDGAEKGEVHGEGRDLHHEGGSPERPLEICRRVRGEYPPPVDYRHAVADRVYLCHVVGREEDRPPILPSLLDEELPYAHSGHDVQSYRRLVEEDYLRVVDEGSRYRDSLPVPRREHVELAVEIIVEAQKLGKRLDPSLRDLRRKAVEL